MSKIELTETNSGYNLQVINNNFNKIKDELNNKVLYRNSPSGEPNAMQTSLDMNGQRIYNLPAPISPSEPARLQDIAEYSEGGSGGVPHANQIPFTPYKNISSTFVQGAIQEVKDDVDAITFPTSSYYGPLPFSPSLRPDGSPIQLGDSYYDTSTQKIPFWNGTEWFTQEDDGEAIKTEIYNHYSNPTGGANTVGYINTGLYAQPRSVAQKLQEAVSVTDFGAVGDGINDDTAAFQAAISSAQTQGKSVYVPGSVGGYLVGSLFLTTSLIGDGGTASKMVRNTTSTGPWFTISANDVEVSGLYLDGAWQPRRCFEVTGYSGVTIDNNRAVNIGEFFLHFNGADQLTISNNQYTSGSNGISNIMPVDSTAGVVSRNVKIIDNHISNIPGTAIQVAGQQSSSNIIAAWSDPKVVFCVISGNTIRNVAGNGIIGQGYYLTISNNTLDDVGDIGGNQGIVPQGYFITVADNVLAYGQGVGIDMGGCSNSTVTGNTITGFAQIGIELQSCTNTTCVGNSIIDCGFGITGHASAGINVSQGYWGSLLTSLNNTVVGNTVRANTSPGDYGIGVGPNVQACLISGNNLVLSGRVAPVFIDSSAAVQYYGNLENANETNRFIIRGSAPTIASRNATGNSDLTFAPQGNGTLRLEKNFATASNPSAFTADVCIPIKDVSGSIYYIPAKWNSTW